MVRPWPRAGVVALASAQPVISVPPGVKAAAAVLGLFRHFLTVRVGRASDRNLVLGRMVLVLPGLAAEEAEGPVVLVPLDSMVAEGVVLVRVALRDPVLAALAVPQAWKVEEDEGPAVLDLPHLAVEGGEDPVVLVPLGLAVAVVRGPALKDPVLAALAVPQAWKVEEDEDPVVLVPPGLAVAEDGVLRLAALRGLAARVVGEVAAQAALVTLTDPKVLTLPMRIARSLALSNGFDDQDR